MRRKKNMAFSWDSEIKTWQRKFKRNIQHCKDIGETEQVNRLELRLKKLAKT